MEAIVPYLTFNGNAAEALTFYSEALNGAVIFQQSYGDSPMESPADYKDKLMHATFKAGDLTFQVTDGIPGQPIIAGTNLSLSLKFNNIAGIEKTFAAFSEGATITMPLQDTFWGARFGMLTDKFGFHWKFNYDLKKKKVNHKFKVTERINE